MDEPWGTPTHHSASQCTEDIPLSPAPATPTTQRKSGSAWWESDFGVVSGTLWGCLDTFNLILRC